MKIYQPVAYGPDGITGARASAVYSRLVYLSVSEAERNLDDFKQRALNQGGHDLGGLDRIDKVVVIELVLEGV